MNGELTDDQRARLDAALAGAQGTVPRVMASLGVAAEDAAQGWAHMAESLLMAADAATDEDERRAVRRALPKVREIAKIAEALRREVDRL